MNPLLSALEEDLQGVLAVLRDAFSRIRTGRATPALVEDAAVEAYGTKMKIKELATITVPEPRQLLVEPWDKSVLGDIERALIKLDLGTSPIVGEQDIRIVLPPLTAERREALVREVNDQVGVAKSKMRKFRQDARGMVEELEDSEGKDFVFRLKTEVDDVVKVVGEDIEELQQKKEQELIG